MGKLWKAKFSILSDVIFLVRLQEKFEIDLLWSAMFCQFNPCSSGEFGGGRRFVPSCQQTFDQDYRLPLPWYGQIRDALPLHWRQMAPVWRSHRARATNRRRRRLDSRVSAAQRCTQICHFPSQCTRTPPGAPGTEWPAWRQKKLVQGFTFTCDVRLGQDGDANGEYVPCWNISCLNLNSVTTTCVNNYRLCESQQTTTICC